MRSNNLSFSVRLLQGNYEICAITDSTNVVKESNEKHNKSCQKLLIRAK
jgi:subtilase family serine protease